MVQMLDLMVQMLDSNRNCFECSFAYRYVLAMDICFPTPFRPKFWTMYPSPSVRQTASLARISD